MRTSNSQGHWRCKSTAEGEDSLCIKPGAPSNAPSNTPSNGPSRDSCAWTGSRRTNKYIYTQAAPLRLYMHHQPERSRKTTPTPPASRVERRVATPQAFIHASYMRSSSLAKPSIVFERYHSTAVLQCTALSIVLFFMFFSSKKK